MAEFIFDLQRFDSSGAGSGTGASSGGSNAKTDGDSETAAAEVWRDGWKAYSTKDRSSFATLAYTLWQTTTPTAYDSTAGIADVINVSGQVNNVINNVDRLDTINFTDMYLESFATFSDCTEENSYVDMIFSNGTVTRLYLADSEFTPTLKFASGLTEAYSFSKKDANDKVIYPGTWFGSEELATSTAYWWNANNFMINYVPCIGTKDVYDILPVSRTTNTFVNASDQDDIFLYDVGSLAEIAVQAGTSGSGSVPTFTKDGGLEHTSSSSALNLTFSNGTAALVYYAEGSTANPDGIYIPNVRSYSPTFYLADGSAYVYNSSLGWRTLDQAVADKAAADSAKAQEALDKAAFDANFNVVYDTQAEIIINDAGDTYSPWNERTPFTASRWYNTALYNANNTNDVYFTDALKTNVVGIIQEDDSNFDLVFDTGAVTRINYLDIVSPVLHFADGAAYVYDYALKDFTRAQSGSYVERGSSSGSSADSNSSADLVESDDITQQPDGTWRGSDGKEYTPLGNNFTDGRYIYNKQEENLGALQSGETSVNSNKKPDRPGQSYTKGVGYEPNYEAFVVSRNENNFINKVTAYDDIVLADTTFDNIADVDITLNYDIVVTFDTGKQLRVRDNSLVSPVFHFADGTQAAYNWRSNQWVGVTDTVQGVAEFLPVSAFTENFIRNVDDSDTVYLADVTQANIAKIYPDAYYVNITFDTGATTAVRYTDRFSPTFMFADGSTLDVKWIYKEALETEVQKLAGNATYEFDIDASYTESFDLSKAVNNTVSYAGREDTVNFIDAASTDITAMNADDENVNFTFDTGTTSTIGYEEIYSPQFNFTDGVTYLYDYRAEILGYGYTGVEGVAEEFAASSSANNVINYTFAEDLVTFDVPWTSLVSNQVVGNNDLVFTFDNGARTSVQFWNDYSPTIQFADGATYSYKYEYTEDGTGNPANWTFSTSPVYTGTWEADTFRVNKNFNNVINESRNDDVVYFSNATLANVTNILADRENSVITVTFDTGTTTTINYTSYGYSPILLFSDGVGYQYYGTTLANEWHNAYVGTGSADVFNVSKTTSNRVDRLGAADTVIVGDATASDITYSYISTSSYSPYIEFTFNDDKTTYIYYDPDEGQTPTIQLADGTTYKYNTYTPKYDEVDNIQISRFNDSIVYYADDEDYVSVVDASIGNIASYGDSSSYRAELTFDTGKTAIVGMYDDVSPLFLFNDGSILAYVGATKSWGTPIKATAGADTFNLNSAAQNIVMNADASDTVYINAASTSLTDLDVDNYGVVGLTFAGGSTTVTYTGNTTPLIVFTDGTLQYNAYSATYEAETFDLEGLTADNLVYNYAGSDDTVNFKDATLSNVSNVTFADYGYDVVFTFDTGATTSVEYSRYGGITPEFTFSDGATYRYVNENSGEAVTNVWQVKDSSGNWSTYGTELVTEAASTSDESSSTSDESSSTSDESSSTSDESTSSSADLWGDVVDTSDGLLTGGSFVTDATLSDFVVPAQFATSFDAGNPFDVQSAGDFVLAFDSTQKSA